MFLGGKGPHMLGFPGISTLHNSAQAAFSVHLLQWQGPNKRSCSALPVMLPANVDSRGHGSAVCRAEKLQTVQATGNTSTQAELPWLFHKR